MEDTEGNSNSTESFDPENTNEEYCRDCHPVEHQHLRYGSIRCPRLPKVKRSGHGKRTYSNRIWMAVEQSKKNSERTWKHLVFKKDSFLGHFDHDNTGKLTGKGVRDNKKFLTYLDSENIEEYQTQFGFLGLKNPFQGLHTTIAGAGACAFKIVEPFEVFSDEYLAEIAELYLMNEIECLGFAEYSDESLREVYGILSKITDRLAYTAKGNHEEWSSSNIFRCVSQTYQEPYLSQFWFYNNKNYTPRKFRISSDPFTDQKYLNKWGFSVGQTASLINGQTQENGNEGPETVGSENFRFSFEKFVSNGYQLGVVSQEYRIHDLLLNVVSNLEMLKIEPNFFHPLHQDFYEITRNQLGFVLENAKIISSYWQWFVHRRITPVEASNAIHRALTEGEGIPSWFLEFTELTDKIAERNEDYLSAYSKQENVVETVRNNDDTFSFLRPQYTLAVSRRNGYCDEPSYPNSKSVQIAAGITFIKFMLKTDVPLSPNLDLYPSKDLMKGPRVKPVLFVPDPEGNMLKATYLEDNRTVTNELDKFMINVGEGQAWSGAATSSDISEGLYLGEQIALRICSDFLTSWYYDNHKLQKTKHPKVMVSLLDGETCVVPSSAYRS